MSTYSDTNRVGRNLHSLHNIWLKFYYMNKIRGKKFLTASIINYKQPSVYAPTQDYATASLIIHVKGYYMYSPITESYQWLCVHAYISKQRASRAGLRRKGENKSNSWHIPIVAIFNVLLWQLSCFRHLMPVRALSTSCALTPYEETAYVCPVSLVIWWGSLEL